MVGAARKSVCVFSSVKKKTVEKTHEPVHYNRDAQKSIENQNDRLTIESVVVVFDVAFSGASLTTLSFLILGHFLRFGG